MSQQVLTAFNFSTLMKAPCFVDSQDHAELILAHQTFGGAAKGLAMAMRKFQVRC